MHQQNIIRDAFIKGLESASIHQRLLEQDDITLQRSLDLALSLNQTQEHATRLNRVEHLATTQDIGHDITQQEYQILPTSTSAAVKNNFAQKHVSFSEVFFTIEMDALQKIYNAFCAVKLDTFHKYVAPRKTLKLRLNVRSYCLSIYAGFPKCLKASVVEETLDEVGVQIFMDAGASESYINHRCFKKIFFKGKPFAITMASTSHSAQVKKAVL